MQQSHGERRPIFSGNQTTGLKLFPIICSVCKRKRQSSQVASGPAQAQHNGGTKSRVISPSHPGRPRVQPATLPSAGAADPTQPNPSFLSSSSSSDDHRPAGEVLRCAAELTSSGAGDPPLGSPGEDAFPPATTSPVAAPRATHAPRGLLSQAITRDYPIPPSPDFSSSTRRGVLNRSVC